MDQEVTEICPIRINIGVKFLAFLFERNIGIYIYALRNTREGRDTMVEEKDWSLSPLMKISKSQ